MLAGRKKEDSDFIRVFFLFACLLCSNVLGEVDDAVAVAPFVVIPGNDLEEVVADFHRGQAVDDGRAWVGVVVDGNEWLVAVAEDALHWAFGGFLEQAVDLFDGEIFFDLEDDVSQGDVWRWHAQREAVHLAVELRDDLAHGFGGTGGRWDDGLGAAAGATWVLVTGVEVFLVVGEGMNGRCLR